MFAAAEGRSTLGISKKVGKEFIAAGPAKKDLPERVGDKEDRANRRYRKGR